MSRSDEKPPVTAKAAPRRGGMGQGPMGMGAPVEKAKDLKGSLRRLVRFLSPYRIGILAVLVAAVLSVAFNIAGPKILGRATNVLFNGVMSRVVTNQLSETFGGTVPAWMDKDTLLLMLDTFGDEKLTAMANQPGGAVPAEVAKQVLAEIGRAHV